MTALVNCDARDRSYIYDVRELKYLLLLPDYAKTSDDGEPHMVHARHRRTLFQWMFDIMVTEFESQYLTVEMAMRLFDMYVGKLGGALCTRDAQTVGCACMVLALKMSPSDIDMVVSIEQLSSFADGASSCEMIRLYEELVFCSLDFDVLVPTTIDFIHDLVATQAFPSRKRRDALVAEAVFVSLMLQLHPHLLRHRLWDLAPACLNLASIRTGIRFAFTWPRWILDKTTVAYIDVVYTELCHAFTPADEDVFIEYRSEPLVLTYKHVALLRPQFFDHTPCKRFRSIT